MGVAPRFVDVCNGDAGGLCAVIQWRLRAPRRAKLVTWLKRDIALLQHVEVRAGDEVLVWDLSLRANRAALSSLLIQCATVHYFDHHLCDDIPFRPAGVVTDRDRVVEVLAKDVAPGSLQASDLLAGPVHTANECASVLDAFWQMSGHGVRRLPVVDDRCDLIGIVTSDDLTHVLADALSDAARTVTTQMRHERTSRP